MELIETLSRKQKGRISPTSKKKKKKKKVGGENPEGHAYEKMLNIIYQKLKQK